MPMTNASFFSSVRNLKACRPRLCTPRDCKCVLRFAGLGDIVQQNSNIPKGRVLEDFQRALDFVYQIYGGVLGVKPPRQIKSFLGQFCRDDHLNHITELSLAGTGLGSVGVGRLSLILRGLDQPGSRPLETVMGDAGIEFVGQWGQELMPNLRSLDLSDNCITCGIVVWSLYSCFFCSRSWSMVCHGNPCAEALPVGNVSLVGYDAEDMAANEVDSFWQLELNQRIPARLIVSGYNPLDLKVQNRKRGDGSFDGTTDHMMNSIMILTVAEPQTFWHFHGAERLATLRRAFPIEMQEEKALYFRLMPTFYDFARIKHDYLRNDPKPFITWVDTGGLENFVRLL